MHSDTGLVKCGDTDFCEECETWDKAQGVPEGPRFLHLNEKGRCDFYFGPSAERVKIQPPR